ncbi:hypothetical protein ETAA8_60090 [Anatilimnocola aggregata]|uniref:Uncharacterized protein n=1 Tax=Anatilimnocola aggregata TaxID=2528021 RepID=A0A517YKX4_9BACT|nr:hypothetical protein [Anatilimnocola aggregata]QDU30860.1 hypothetical protein ETAA8_60090 [Anatilimnocola aggregata]
MLCRVFSSVCCSLLVIGSLCPTEARAQDYKVEKIDQAAPADELAPEIAGLLQPTGFKFVKGESRTVCEIWPCKEWPLKGDKVGGDVIYPLQPGQVIGVIRYPRKGGDFRDQDIPPGTYVLRYGQQPVDGAHVGTSPTRDFLLLLPAANDRSPAALEYKPLVAASKETTGATHPAILSLQRLSDSTEALAVRHNEEKEWWIIRFVGKTSQGGKSADQAMELVVVGNAGE